MKARKTLPITTVLLILALALSTVGVGYGLWAKTLNIVGTVHTGKVDAALSVEEVDQLFDFNDRCPNGQYSIGIDCDQDGFLNDDWEVEEKDIAECVAFLDKDNPAKMYVEITEGYPSFNCFVRYDVTNTGTIPIKIHSPVYTNPHPDEIHFNGWPPICYTNDTQLEEGEKAYCNLHIHVEQPAAMNTTYTVGIEIFGHQWNEEP